MHILVAPLNWGLGHASRCIPIIYHLLEKGHTVSLASEGRAAAFLQKQFPNLPLHELPSYDIQYSKKAIALKIISQIPKILHAIHAENAWLKTNLPVYQWDAVISDNRYGMCHPKVSCVFLSNQLSPITPLRSLTTWIQEKKIANFSECWVPDYEEERYNLCGNLTRNVKLSVPIRYLGVLSRFSCISLPKNFKNEYLRDFWRDSPPDITAILSGPEPQRTLLADIFIKKIQQTNFTYLLIEGKTEGRNAVRTAKGLIINHVESEDFKRVLTQSSRILSRSGFSSLSDYLFLGVKEILLIPTPEQTEQIQIAHIAFKKGLAQTLSQAEFKKNEFPKTPWGEGGKIELPDFNWQKTVDDWLQRVKKEKHNP